MFSNYKIANLKEEIVKSLLLNYSTVTDLAKFLGLSTSNPFSLEI